MIYFHDSICISPQNSFDSTVLSEIRESKNNMLEVAEPNYPGIPPAAKRRMGKSVRMAVGAAIPLLNKEAPPAGIVIATANGGMEDCIKFLNQILEYKEGLLTPANFVQSTSNASAAQIALVTKNHSYNTTHVHRGIAFENAVMDVMMLLSEKKDAVYLLGSTDEISPYNYNIDRLAGWYLNEPVSNADIFKYPANGTIAGEGAFMVLVNNDRQGAVAVMKAVKTIHSKETEQVTNSLKKFLSENFTASEMPELILTGENGDIRLNKYYDAVESMFDQNIPVARFKHLCGEYCTASSFACWLSMQIIQTGITPDILLKKNKSSRPCKRILIYNNYRGEQHGFMLVEGVDQ